VLNNKLDPRKRATDLSSLISHSLYSILSNVALLVFIRDLRSVLLNLALDPTFDENCKFADSETIPGAGVNQFECASLAQASVRGTVNGRRVKMICWIHLGLLNAADIS
jgi:hypothetical protein